MRRILSCGVACLIFSIASCATTEEFCEADDVSEKDVYMLEASWGTHSQLRLDYRKVFKELYQPKGYCVCNPGVKSTGWLFLTHKASCKQLFEELLEKLSSSEYVWPPPKDMPSHLIHEFTLGGKAQVSHMYHSQQYNQNPEPHKWTKHLLDGLIAKASQKEEFSYGAETHYLYNVFDEYPVSGNQGIVLGSEYPWVEGILMAKGAKSLTTVEYQEIRSDYSNLKTLTPKELAQHWLGNKLPEYDFAVSFSSYEHDGLGRYGDPIDPWGDIWDVRRIGCMIKPDGLLFLGVPMGPDQVVWNAHRIYGPFRLPLLTANFELIGAYDGEGWINDYNRIWSYSPQRLSQPFLVLKNRRTDACKR